MRAQGDPVNRIRGFLKRPIVRRLALALGGALAAYVAAKAGVSEEAVLAVLRWIFLLVAGA